jgi:hypothetical protein
MGGCFTQFAEFIQNGAVLYPFRQRCGELRAAHHAKSY